MSIGGGDPYSVLNSQNPGGRRRPFRNHPSPNRFQTSPVDARGRGPRVNSGPNTNGPDYSPPLGQRRGSVSGGTPSNNGTFTGLVPTANGRGRRVYGATQEQIDAIIAEEKRKAEQAAAATNKAVSYTPAPVSVNVNTRPSFAFGSADNMERQISNAIANGWRPIPQEEPVEAGSGLIGSLRPRPTTTGTGAGGGNGDEYNIAPDPMDIANEALTRAQVEAAWKNAIAQAAASEAAAQATYDETIRRMNQSRPGQLMDLATLFSGRGLALSGARADATQDFVRQDLERRADLAAARDQQTLNANTIVANLAERFAGQIDDAELQTLLKTLATAAGYQLA